VRARAHGSLACIAMLVCRLGDAYIAKS